jgi:hypothetical protein
MFDPSTATMGDVITRSCEMHPSLFSDAMRSARDVHAGYMRITRDHAAFRIARDMARQLDAMAKALRTEGTLDPASLEFGARVQAFHIAARLQCIPPSVANDIAGRSA